MVEFIFILSLVIFLGVNLALSDWRTTKIYLSVLGIAFLVAFTLYLFTGVYNKKSILLFFALLFLTVGVGVFLSRRR